MKNSFAKIGAFTPKIKVADVNYNKKQIIKEISDGAKKDLAILVFPELVLSGSTCGDLFYSDSLLTACKDAIIEIAKSTSGIKTLTFIGLPLKVNGKIYDVAVCLSNGNILGIVPRNFDCDFDELNLKKYFSTFYDFDEIDLNDDFTEIPFGEKIVFEGLNNKKLKVCVEIGENLYSPLTSAKRLCYDGANVVVNLSSEIEYSGREKDRLNYISMVSKQSVCAYCLCNSGKGESSTDAVFSGQSIICENGEILAKTEAFSQGFCVSSIDVDYLESQKAMQKDSLGEEKIIVQFECEKSSEIIREYSKYPFIIDGEQARLIDIQTQGLIKRIEHTNAKSLVIGLSGGLDSALAVLVCVNAMKKLNRPLKDILAYTLPCFGTTSRTLDNSIILAKSLGISIKKIDISKSVKRHLKDIGHDGATLDAAFENAQARERTQVLMDMANMHNGLVIGTGDLSELALGWATYNGDHMSMYGVNGSVPKTLVRELVNFTAKRSRGKLKSVLLDVLDTPVSPELLPPSDTEIKQKTEDIVGPYVLHDFYMYHLLKRQSSPRTVYEIAKLTFKNEFSEETILKWLKTFIKRFFSQQFKRSCLPDGVKVSPISLSPRTGIKLPSDAISSVWLSELENL